MTISDLLVTLKERLSKFTCSVIDENLTARDTSYLIYNSTSKSWLEFPSERIRVINLSGVETFLPKSEYVVNRDDGYVTLNVARLASDIVRADYEKKPFSDAELTSILASAVKQIRVLSFHNINVLNIHENYSEAVIKKAYTIALREIQFPTTKYFALNIAGRSIDKSTQVTQINTLIDSNEKELTADINAIRYYDKTNIII